MIYRRYGNLHFRVKPKGLFDSMMKIEERIRQVDLTMEAAKVSLEGLTPAEIGRQEEGHRKAPG